MPVTDAQLVGLVAQGLDVRQIALSTGETLGMIRDLLQASGLKAPEPQPQPRVAGTALLTAAYLKTEYVVNGHTIIEVGDLAGVSEATVLRYMRAHGISRRKAAARDRLRPEQLVAIRGRLKAAAKSKSTDTVTAIASDFEVSRQTIYNVRDRKYHKAVG